MNWKKLLAASVLLGSLLFPATALAQLTPTGSACPYMAPGAILTAAQWNYCFQIKQDNLNFTPFNSTGGTFSGPVVTFTPTAAGAGFNLPEGVSPGAPNNGDLWTTSLGLFVQINGATIGPLVSTSSANVASVSNSDGTITFSPTTGAVVGSLNLSHANTWGAVQTFPSSDLAIKGSSTGVTSLASANASGTNYVATLPATTDTIAVLGTNQTFSATENFTGTFQVGGNTMTFPATAQTLAGLGTVQSWTALQTFGNQDLAIKGSSTGITTLESANVGGTNFTLILPATNDTFAVLGTNQTFSATETITGTLNISTGIFQVGGNTMTFPATAQTLAGLSTAQTWGAVQTFPTSDIAIKGTSTGVTNLASANSGASNFTATLQALTGTICVTGQCPGSSTNDSANAGNIGEFFQMNSNQASFTGTTITDASPGVVTWSGNTITVGSAVYFSSLTGAAGLSTNTTYYVCSGNFTAGTSFALSTSVTNALAGTCINTTSAGTAFTIKSQTYQLSSTVAADIGGLSLTAGDWDVWGAVCWLPNATTVVTNEEVWLNTVSTTAPTYNGGNTNWTPMPATGFEGAGTSGTYCTPIGPSRFSLSATTTIYLDGDTTFSGGGDTVFASGWLDARRAR
jgi:hypothetical protein